MRALFGYHCTNNTWAHYTKIGYKALKEDAGGITTFRILTGAIIHGVVTK